MFILYNLNNVRVTMPPIDHRWETTSLHYAVEQGDKRHVMRLIVHQHGDVDKKNDRGLSCLDIAVQRKNHDMLKLLSNFTRQPSISDHSFNLFYLEFHELGQLRLFQQILTIHFENYLGYTPLHIILKYLPHEIGAIEMLLDRINPNIPDIDGNNYLHIICQMTKMCSRLKLRLASLFIDKGVDINARNRLTHTPLMISVIQRDSQLTGLLLMRGAISNMKDHMNLNSFHYAVGFHDCLKMLIKYIVLDKYRNLPVDEEILQGINGHPDWRRIYTTCEREIEFLRHTRIIRSSELSHFDILISSVYEVSKMLKNQKVIIAFRTRLPNVLYKTDLAYRFCQGLERKFTNDMAFKVVDSLMGNILPNICLNKISDYFNAKDEPVLKSYLDSCNVTRASVRQSDCQTMYQSIFRIRNRSPFRIRDQWSLSAEDIEKTIFQKLWRIAMGS